MPGQPSLLIHSNNETLTSGNEVPLFGGGDTATELNTQFQITEAATITRLRGYVKSGGSGTNTLTLRKNGANGVNTCNRIGVGLMEDTTNSDSFAAGDLCNVAYTDTGTDSVMSHIAANITFASGTGAIHGVASVTTPVAITTASVTRFLGLAGPVVYSSTESPVAYRNKGYTSVAAIQIRVTANARTATTFKNRKNGADGTGSVTITASTTGLFVDTTIGDSLAPDDTICMAIVTGTGTASMSVSLAAMTLKSANDLTDIIVGAGAGAAITPSALDQNVGGVLNTTDIGAANPNGVISRISGSFIQFRCNVTANAHLSSRGLSMTLVNSTSIIMFIPQGLTGWFENSLSTLTLASNAQMAWTFGVTGTTGNVTISYIGATIRPPQYINMPQAMLKLQGYKGFDLTRSTGGISITTPGVGDDRTATKFSAILSGFLAKAGVDILRSSGKYYFEMRMVSLTSVSSTPTSMSGVGLGSSTDVVDTGNPLGKSITSCGYYPNGEVWQGNAVVANLATYTENDVIGVYWDAATRNVWFTKNGSLSSGDPVAGTGAHATLSAASVYPSVQILQGPSDYEQARVNLALNDFGTRPSTPYLPWEDPIKLPSLSISTPVVVSAPDGALTATGYAPDFKRSYAATVPQGALTFNGQAPTLIRNTNVTPVNGQVSMTGLIAALAWAYAATVPEGTLSMASDAPAITQQLVIAPSDGVLTATGLVPSLARAYAATVPEGALFFTGFTPALARAYAATVSSGALSFTGLAPSYTLALVLNPAAGALALNAFAADLRRAYAATVPAGALVLSSDRPLLDRAIVPGAGALNLTAFAPSLARAYSAIVQNGALALNGQAPNLVRSDVITVANGALSFTGFSPAFARAYATIVNAGALSLNGQSPSLARAYATIVGSGLLSLTGYAPDTDISVQVVPAAGALSALGFAPALQRAYAATVPAGSLTLTGYAPANDTRISIALGTLSVNGNAPAINQRYVVLYTESMVMAVDYAARLQAVASVDFDTAAADSYTAGLVATALVLEVANNEVLYSNAAKISAAINELLLTAVALASRQTHNASVEFDITIDVNNNQIDPRFEVSESVTVTVSFLDQLISANIEIDSPGWSQAAGPTNWQQDAGPKEWSKTATPSEWGSDNSGEEWTAEVQPREWS